MTQRISVRYAIKTDYCAIIFAKPFVRKRKNISNDFLMHKAWLYSVHNLFFPSRSEPVYVPFLIVGSIFLAFLFVGSFVAVYCCTCLRPKQTLPQPIRFSLRSYQMETLPMILTSTSLRTPSRQSSSAASSSCTAGSLGRFSFARPESICTAAPSPPPYTPGCLQMGHSVSLSQPSGFLVSGPYFSYPLDSEPSLTGKSVPET